MAATGAGVMAAAADVVAAAAGVVAAAAGTAAAAVGYDDDASERFALTDGSKRKGRACCHSVML